MTFQTQFPQLLQRIKADSPLIHCITNHISIHDCANALLALGHLPSWPSTLGRLQKSPPRPKPLW